MDTQSFMPEPRFAQDSLEPEFIGYINPVTNIQTVEQALLNVLRNTTLHVHCQLPEDLTEFREWRIDSFNQKVESSIRTQFGISNVSLGEATSNEGAFKLPVVVQPGWKESMNKCGLENGKVRFRADFVLGRPEQTGMATTYYIYVAGALGEYLEMLGVRTVFEQRVQEYFSSGGARVEFADRMPPTRFELVLPVGMKMNRDQYHLETYVQEVETAYNTMPPDASNDRQALQAELNRLKNIRTCLTSPPLTSSIRLKSSAEPEYITLQLKPGTPTTHLAWFGATETLAIMDQDFKVLMTYPAANNVDSTSEGTWPKGRFNFKGHVSKTPDPNGKYGSHGFFHFEVSGRTEMGIHSGRENDPDELDRKGIHHCTKGCIRTTDGGTGYLYNRFSSEGLQYLWVLPETPYDMNMCVVSQIYKAGDEIP